MSHSVLGQSVRNQVSQWHADIHVKVCNSHEILTDNHLYAFEIFLSPG